jgi:hypothetical protein
MTLFLGYFSCIFTCILGYSLHICALYLKNFLRTHTLQIRLICIYLSSPPAYLYAIMKVSDEFDSIDDVKKAIHTYLLDRGESWKFKNSNSKRYTIVYKDSVCMFHIRVTLSKQGIAKITKFDEHSYSPTTHYNHKLAHLVNYLIDHHRASIIDDRKITVAQIQSNERLHYSNNINHIYGTSQRCIGNISIHSRRQLNSLPQF